MSTWTCVPFAELPLRRLYDLLALRQRVFVVEQACAYLDADGHDPGCHHLFDAAGDAPARAYLRLAPPGVLYAEASLGRVVVEPAARGTGLGRALVLEGIARCGALHPGAAIRIGAQAHLQALYEATGFVAFGEIYDEDGIAHIAMQRAAE